jgi:hypothetical protein
MRKRELRWRRFLPLLGLLAVIVVPAAQAGSATVVQVTNDTNRDAETSIAINPNDASNVVAGWITSGERTCGYGVSFDGGLTWPVIGVIPGITKDTGGTFEIGTDPSVTFDKNGNAYYTCLAFDNFPPGTGSSGTIFVSKSGDGGVSWGTPVAAIDRQSAKGQHLGDFVDHQFITSNPVSGAIYLTETDFNSFGKPVILFTRSTDGNQAWSPPVQINDNGGNATFQDSFSAAKDANTIYVTYGAFSNAGLSNWNRNYIAKSTDGGHTFSSPQLLAQVTPLPDPLPNASWRSDNNLWVAVDQSANQILVNYADYNAGNADVKLMRVNDLGDHFQVQRITRVNSDSTTSDQFFPFVTVAPGGRIDICFQDRSYLPGNSLIFTTCAFSSDHGSSFSSQQVTTTPFDASNNDFIGDYNWQASTADAVLPIFVGDKTPTADQLGQEVFVARVTP